MNHDGGGPYWKLYHNSNISKLWKNSTFIYACIKFKYLFESGPCIWYKAEDNKFNLIHLQLAQTWSENGTVHWPARTTERAQRITSARAEHEIGTTPRDVVGVRHCVRHSGRHIRPQSGRGAWAGQSPSCASVCPSMLVVDTVRGALHIVTHCRLRCTKRLVWTRCLDVDASTAAGFLKTGRESVAERWSLINEQLPLGRELE